MERNGTVFRNLRGYIQRDTGKERGQFHRGGGTVGGGNGRIVLVEIDVGDKKLVCPHLDHRLLVIHRRNTRAGKDLHVTLLSQQLDQATEIPALTLAENRPPRSEAVIAWPARDWAVK